MAEVSSVTILEYEESVGLDQACLHALYRDLGPLGAESVLCRAMSEIATRLNALDEPYRAGKWSDVARRARVLSAIADQVGMTLLGNVARGVADCANRQEAVALGANLSRLNRIAHLSLAEVWAMTGTDV